MNEIHIVIAGKAHSGKSTIASIIADALNNEGIPTTVDTEKRKTLLKKRFKAIKKLGKNDTKVSVKMLQTNRDGKVLERMP
jgi:thymidylate kinase